MLAPDVLVAIREDKKQAPYLYALADREQRRQLFRAQGGQAFEDFIQILEIGIVVQFVEGFENSPLRGGCL